MKQFLILGLILLGTPDLLPAQETIPAKVILRDPRHLVGSTQKRSPSLIPTRLLEKPFEQWSAEDQNRAPREYFDRFNAIVESVRAHGTSGQCMPGKGFPEKSPTPEPGEKRFSLFQVAGSTKNVLVGEVVATEPAWDPLTLQIYTLVHLKVQKIVQGLDAIEVGDIVTYRRFWGTATIRGITLCSYVTGSSSSQTLPAKETPERLRPTFLILGHLIPGNGLFIDTNDFEEFQVIDGTVHYPPGIPYYRDNKPEKMEELLLRFQGNSR